MRRCKWRRSNRGWRSQESTYAVDTRACSTTRVVNRRWPSGLLLVPTAVATESSLTSLISGQDRRGCRRRPAASATAGSAARTRRTSSKTSCKLQVDTKNMDEFKVGDKTMSREKRKSFQSQSVLHCSSSERKAVKKRKRAEDVAPIE